MMSTPTPQREGDHPARREAQDDAGLTRHSSYTADGATGQAVDQANWPWSASRTMGMAALWIVGAIALALLSVAAHHAGPFRGDVSIEEWVQQLHQPALVRFINFASDANWPKPAGITAIVVIVLLALARQFRAAISAAVGGFGADYINVTLNGIVQRPRPHNVHIHAVAHLGLYSYPSGHVTHVIAFYGTLLYLSFLAERARPRLRPLLWVARVICLYFMVFIGPSRVLEGEHWPSDVVASYILGSLMLVVGIVVFHLLGMAWARIRERRSSRQPRQSAGSAALPA